MGEIVPQIAGLAWASAVGVFILVYGVGALLGKKAFSMKDPFELVVGSGILVGIPAGLAAFVSLFFLPILLAIPLPLSGWAIGAAVGIAWWILMIQQNPKGLKGCTALFMTGAAAYLTAMAGWAIALADPPTGEVGMFIKPVLLATPFVALGAEGSRGNWARALMFGTFMAFFLALGFVPIDMGFGAAVLPDSPWLKFPIGGVVGMTIWIVVPRALMTIWALIFKVKMDDWREFAFKFNILGAIGLVLGLLYAALTVLGL